MTNIMTLDNNTTIKDLDFISSGLKPVSQIVTIFGSKFTPGGDNCDGSIPLSDILKENWGYDAHFTQYWSPSETRLIKGGNTTGINFPIICYDYDFDNHKSYPNFNNFHTLCRYAFLLQMYNLPSPNIVYSTRGGARFIYLIKPINDPINFENKAEALAQKLANDMKRASNIGYKIDLTAKDWTRLFRCPNVIRDGCKHWNVPIRMFHDNQLDTSDYTIKNKTTPIIHPPGSININNKKFLELCYKIYPGNRNNALFRACMYACLDKDHNKALKMIQIAADWAEKAGLSKREIELIAKKAYDIILSSQNINWNDRAANWKRLLDHDGRRKMFNFS